MLKNLRQQIKLQYDKSTNGTLKIYRDKYAMDNSAEFSKLLRDLGIRYKVLGANEVADVEPALSSIGSNIAGGIFYQDDESGDAFKYCQGLAEHAADRGVNFQYNTVVEAINRVSDRISGLKTTAGNLEADTYILAAGSFSTLIAKAANLSLPIRPVKGYSLTLNLNGWYSGPKIPVVDDSLHAAVTPLGEKLRIGGTAEFNGYNTDVNQCRINNLFKFLSNIYPDFVPYIDKYSARQWAGLRPYSCDGVPILGETPLKNLYLNTGHGHLGWSMAAGSGKLIADLISGCDTEIDISPYNLDRF